MMAKLCLCLALVLSTPAFAELIQILHTNDLHSHLDHAPQDTQLGGYARIKSLIDKHRRLALDQGIGTIAMDAGDTMEGNLYYMADKGKRSLEAFNAVGYDVAVLGNHDYLMGAEDLEAIVREVPPTFNLLAANFELDGRFPHVKQHVKPVWETVVNGVKVGVVGITLNDMLYKWRLKGNGWIMAEVAAARYWARYLRSRGNEVVIALTHLGIKKDKMLAYNVPEIDLIVGGHDHTTMTEPFYQESWNGKRIPIVQVGKAGEWLGKILLDYDKSTQTLSFRDFTVMPTVSEEQDPGVLAVVERANEDLYRMYGREWLLGVMGQSLLRPPKVVDDRVTWHFFVNDSMLEASGADFAVHVADLTGENYPIGMVTRKEIYDNNPRSFDFEDVHGYHVYTIRMNGGLIKLLAQVCMNLNLPLYVSGITFQWRKKANGKYSVWNIRHRGERIRFTRWYTVALSESIVRGGFGITPYVKAIFRSVVRTPISMWQAIGDKFQREGVLRTDYLDRYYRRESEGKLLVEGPEEMERVMVPAPSI